MFPENSEILKKKNVIATDHDSINDPECNDENNVDLAPVESPGCSTPTINHSYILSEKLPRTILGESTLLNSSESFSSMPCAQKGISPSVLTDAIRDQQLEESVIKSL